jgi:hypothetical protein
MRYLVSSLLLTYIPITADKRLCDVELLHVRFHAQSYLWFVYPPWKSRKSTPNSSSPSLHAHHHLRAKVTMETGLLAS